jgi:hypothetical protein
MDNKEVIFLHSMFRAGSTYMFNKFRLNKDFYTYYEPLHHDLERLKKESLDIWKYDKKATKVMNHPSLDKPHFYEFKTAFNNSSDNLPFYDTSFAYLEFFKVSKDIELKKYIDNMIYTAPENKKTLFQFNRTSGRIEWFKKNYPNSVNIFLLRNPRDQFESYIQRGEIGKNIFIAINLYIILTKKEIFSKLLSSNFLDFTFSDNVPKDLMACMKLTKKVDIKDHYKIFYYIWLTSYIHATEYADLIIDMDKMNKDNEYKINIENNELISNNSGINFEDYKIKENNKFCLKYDSFINLEKVVLEFVEMHDNTKKDLCMYLEKFDICTNIKKDTFFRSLFRKFVK